jgi:hypothetical protein
MLFRMMFLYLPRLAVYWYGGFTVKNGNGFVQICADNPLTLRHHCNLMKVMIFLGLERSSRLWNTGGKKPHEISTH